MKSLIGYFLISFLCGQICRGVDWPTYGGPENKHCTSEETLRLNWGEDEPKVLWKQNVGLGYSSVIEVNGLAYTQGYKDNQNTLYCVEANSGAIKWTYAYKSGLGDKYFQGGSRSTPTIARDKIFLQGHEGPLFCLDAKTGKLAGKDIWLWTLMVFAYLGVFRSTIGLR